MLLFVFFFVFFFVGYQNDVVNFLLSATMMFAAILTFILVASSFGVATIPVGDEFCKAFFYIFYVTCYLATFSTYFVLWFRIYAAFYRNSIFQQSMSKCFYYIHILLLPFLFVFFVIIIGLLLLNFIFESNGCECRTTVVVQNYVYEQYYSQLIRIRVFQNISVFLPLVIEFILLISFIIPLYLYKRRMTNRGLTQNNTTKKITVRVVIVAAVSIVTHLLTGVLSVTLFPDLSSFLIHLLSIGNVFIKFIGVIISFADWQERLFSLSF